MRITASRDIWERRLADPLWVERWHRATHLNCQHRRARFQRKERAKAEFKRMSNAYDDIFASIRSRVSRTTKKVGWFTRLLRWFLSWQYEKISNWQLRRARSQAQEFGQ
jgi:hypothetical protein